MLKFMFGAMIGAALALLLAPKSGEELREDVSNQLNDKFEQGKTMARKVSRRARELSDQAQEQMRRAETSLTAE
jgi:gas vesicle protein